MVNVVHEFVEVNSSSADLTRKSRGKEVCDTRLSCSYGSINIETSWWSRGLSGNKSGVVGICEFILKIGKTRHESLLVRVWSQTISSQEALVCRLEGGFIHVDIMVQGDTNISSDH